MLYILDNFATRIGMRASRMNTFAGTPTVVFAYCLLQWAVHHQMEQKILKKKG